MSQFAIALIGAAQGLLLVFLVEDRAETDAFLAAYSLYLALVLVGASLRFSVLSLFKAAGADERRFREHAGEIASRLMLVGLLSALPLLVTAPLVGPLLTRGLPDDAQHTAVLSLAILAPATYFQVHANTLAAALGAARRFTFSGLVFVAGGLGALAVSAALMAAIGAVGAAIGLLMGAALVAGAHSAYMRYFGVVLRPRLAWLRERRQGQIALIALAGSALGFTIQLNLAVSLSAVSGEAGAITAYAYAFFLLTLLLGISSLPVGLVTLPAVIDELSRRGTRAAEDHVVAIAPYAFAVYAPLYMALVAFGHPLLEWLFEGSLSAAGVALLHRLAVVLGAAGVPVGVMYLTVGITFALGRERRYLVMCLVFAALHALVMAPLAGLGPVAVAGGQAVVSTVATGLLLRITFGPRWPAVALRLLRIASVAIALAGVFPLARLVLGGEAGPGLALAAAAVSMLAYLLLARIAWPTVIRAFLRLVSPRGWRG